MDNIIENYLEQFEELGLNEQVAVSHFANTLIGILEKSNPARFTNGRGKLLYVKIDCDPEKVVKAMLGRFEETK